MSSEPPNAPALAIVGGTGPEGRGLALRFSRLGLKVIIGSRSRERAEEAVRELREAGGGDRLEGMDNLAAVRAGDVVILTIPYAGVADTLPSLHRVVTGKIVVSAIAPVEFRDGRPVALQPAAGSAAQEVQQLLPQARVVSAFQTIDAHQLQAIESELDTDVLVASDDQEARREIMRLAGQLPGVRALSAGRLSSSRYVEECTALLIVLNRIYKSHSGLRITGINR